MTEKETTARGFRIDHFVDRYGSSCSLQKSSTAMDDCIWFGVDKANPQILATAALTMGRADIAAGETTGWVPFPFPEGVQFSTRMHLTREQVKALMPALVHFVETGDLP